MIDQPLEKLLDVRQTAALLGYHPKTVYRLVEQGRLPCVRLGGTRIRFRRRDLERWIEGR